MWFLTCDGDLFNGKRIWLRPGSQHLLGRTTSPPEGSERQQHISHKSVSRKHLRIDVDELKPGNSAQIYARSTVKITDNSTVGTALNNAVLKKESRTLEGKTNTIKLGVYGDLFHINWEPVTLSFGAKKSNDSLGKRRKDLEQADIKLISDYVVNETTHAVAKKRNTISSLLALVDESWVVTEEFVNKLVNAVTRPKEGAEIPLEDDFEANWPNEADFIVPAGAEPYQRPDSLLKLDARRREVFQDYTFVFLSQSQYDSLLPVITTGGGKAVLKDAADLEQDNVQDVVEYVKSVAGQKDAEGFRLSQQSGPGGVVVIRTLGHERAEFIAAVDRALGQRSVEQNEFLDAILMVDASGLRQWLRSEEEDVGGNATSHPSHDAPVSQGRQQQQQRAITVAYSPAPEQRERPSRTANERQDNSDPAPEQQAPDEPTEPPRKRTRRVITQSRFRGFDDFDPSQFSRPASASPEPSAIEPSQRSNGASMDDDEPSQAQAAMTRSSLKRPAPTEAEEQEDMYAGILTGYTAMKRQKTHAAGTSDERVSTSKSPGEADAGTVSSAKAPKRKTKEMDVPASLQALRKHQEDQRRADEEALRQKLPEGTTIEDLKNLAIVEEMEVPDRSDRPSRSTRQGPDGDRWDPAWNGRKNFKKFRRQGEGNGAGAVGRLQRVMIPLEEVPRKGRGIGEEYWLNSSSAETNRNSKKGKSQSQSQSTRAGGARTQRGSEAEGDEEEEASQFRQRRRLEKSRQDAEDAAAREEIFPEEIAGQPRDERIQAAIDATPTQTLATESQRKAAGKRPAMQQAGGPAKKARQGRGEAATRRNVGDDDDDDGLRFRRRG